MKVIEVVSGATGDEDDDLFTMSGDCVPGCESDSGSPIPSEDAAPTSEGREIAFKVFRKWWIDICCGKGLAAETSVLQ